MMRLSLRTAFVLLLSLMAAPADAAGPRDRMLVSAAWLKVHLKDPSLVLFHVGPRAQYDSAHIPGARFLALRSITEEKNGLTYELPAVATLDSVLAANGVTAKSRLVLYYGTDWVSPTTRAWFTLDYLGMGERTSILDGGLAAWQAAGQPVTSEAPPAPAAGSLHSTPRPEVVVTSEWVKGRLGDPRITIVDARDIDHYRGLEAMQRHNGHLPGARHLYFGSLVGDDLFFLPDSALRRLFREAGVVNGQQVVAYCHIGQQATVVYFASRLLGMDVKLYDGSFTEWGERDDLPVEGGIPFTKGALISPSDLAARISAGDVTVIDVRSDLPAYLAGHLPGAAYLHYETLRATRRGVPADTLSLAAYADLLGGLGVRRDRPVVVYGSGDGANFNATFLLWVLTGLRHPEVYLLDGGYARWTAESRALERQYPKVTPAVYPGDTYALEVAPAGWLRGSIGQPDVAIVDVRPKDQFDGSAGAQLRRGHIPGAIHHFWQDDFRVEAGVKLWKPVEELRASYVAQGITPEKMVFVYCNTGTEASHVYFALRMLLGYPQVRVYVPSWTEWAARTELPVEGPAAAGN